MRVWAAGQGAAGGRAVLECPTLPQCGGRAGGRAGGRVGGCWSAQPRRSGLTAAA